MVNNSVIGGCNMGQAIISHAIASIPSDVTNIAKESTPRKIRDTHPQEKPIKAMNKMDTNDTTKRKKSGKRNATKRTATTIG